jgi:hypothetical protein
MSHHWTSKPWAFVKSSLLSGCERDARWTLARDRLIERHRIYCRDRVKAQPDSIKSSFSSMKRCVLAWPLLYWVSGGQVFLSIPSPCAITPHTLTRGYSDVHHVHLRSAEGRI